MGSGIIKIIEEKRQREREREAYSIKIKEQKVQGGRKWGAFQQKKGKLSTSSHFSTLIAIPFPKSHVLLSSLLFCSTCWEVRHSGKQHTCHQIPLGGLHLGHLSLPQIIKHLFIIIIVFKGKKG